MNGKDPAQSVAAALHALPSGSIGLAVSGGSDSLALMYLAAEALKAQQRVHTLHAVTVDHGLRPEARREASEVARHAEKLGITHDCLTWEDGSTFAAAGQGNLMDAARRARYALMAQWALAKNIQYVLLGHTQDDVAETLLMRLARGAGVDGLAAMSGTKSVEDVIFCRPLLQTSRADLRERLRARDVQWIEDPSNDNRQFERVRMRQALADLSQIGLGAAALGQASQNLAQARQALDWSVAQFAQMHVVQRAGDLLIRANPFAEMPAELQRRLLLHALLWIGGQGYGPRGAALLQFQQQALAGQGATLAGVRMTHRSGCIYLHREYAALRDCRELPGSLFDARWQIVQTAQTAGEAAQHQRQTEGITIAPLGEAGLRQCPVWRDSQRPAAAVMADPAVWRDDQLISAPLAGFLQGWQAELAPNCRDFAKWLVSR